MSFSKLKTDFEALRDLCILIRRDYNTYMDLFFSGNDELLVKTASTFFNDLAEILQRDWLLQVTKLMDPAETKRKGQVLENLTIKLIDKQLQDHGLLNSRIESLSDALLAYGEKLRPARDKRLAHLDREHHLNPTPLGRTSKQELDTFLNNLQEYCDEVGRAIGTGPLDFSCSSCKGDVVDLISQLSKARRCP